MIPYVPTWEAHNTSAHNLVGKFTKAYCNVPRGKVQRYLQPPLPLPAAETLANKTIRTVYAMLRDSTEYPAQPIRARMYYQSKNATDQMNIQQPESVQSREYITR